MNKQEQIIEGLEKMILQLMENGTDHDLEQLPELLEQYRALTTMPNSKQEQSLGQKLTAKVYVHNWEEFHELIDQVRKDKNRLEQSFENLKAFVPDVKIN